MRLHHIKKYFKSGFGLAGRNTLCFVENATYVDRRLNRIGRHFQASDHVFFWYSLSMIRTLQLAIYFAHTYSNVVGIRSTLRIV